MSHVMELLGTLEGYDIFFCWICGKTKAVKWGPPVKQATIARGDTAVVHTASKGGIQFFADLRTDDTK